VTVFTAWVATTRRHVLAEGPVWWAEKSEIIWIDVEEGQVFTGRLTGEVIEPAQEFEFAGRVGAAVPGDDGSLLVAKHDRLVVVDIRGHRSEGPAIIPPGVDSRSNDGKCDPRGRFLIGTLALDDRHGQEFLLRWELDGSLTTLDSNLTLSNGLAWSPDGALLYSTDTVPGVIWERDYDAETGSSGPRRQYLHIDDGYPDGICVDALGNVWVAIWGGGEVRSFSPAGILRDRVHVAAPHVSSVAFVGDDLSTLLITTASRDLSPDELRAYPGAGQLFLAKVGVGGTPVRTWDSSSARAFSL
jgi:sugar lactone lactonase YvrE